MYLREEDLRVERSSQLNWAMLKKTVLRRKKEFDNVYKKGKSLADKYVVVFYRKNNKDYSRISFLASKKVGNSVKRNRARRLMKEAYRLSDMKIADGYDFIFIARNRIVDSKCWNVQKSIESALRRTKVVKQ